MLDIIIFANSFGKNMDPNIPKALCKLAGRSFLDYILDSIVALNPASINIIYGPGGESIKNTYRDLSNINFIYQEIPNENNHTIKEILLILSKKESHFQPNFTMILCGHVPLIKTSTLQSLLKRGLTGTVILTNLISNPDEHNRIFYDKDGSVSKLVRYANKEKRIEECNIYEVSSEVLVISDFHLKNLLEQIHMHGPSDDDFLSLQTIVMKALKKGLIINTYKLNSTWEGIGINTRRKQIDFERSWQRKQAYKQIKQGVYISDPERFDLRGNLHCGSNVFIDINCIFEGNVYLGDETHIESNCILKDVKTGKKSRINAYSYLQQAILSENVQVGPFSRIRPQTELQKNVCIGSFVEVKNSTLEENTKASHLSYIGDSDIGKDVNIGAGVITCNYNGANKFRTIIRDNAFIGADSQLIAPIQIGKKATIGAGTTLTKDAPEGQLTISRINQVSIDTWKGPKDN